MKFRALTIGILLALACSSAWADRTLTSHKRGDTDYFTGCFGLYTDTDPTTLATGVTTGDISIEYQADNQATATSMTVEGITTIGTFEQPSSAAHARFEECDTTSGQDGTYQLILHDDLMATSNMKELTLRLTGTGIVDEIFHINTNLVDTADIQSSADAALVALALDHLVAVADSDDAVDNSLWCKMISSDGDCSGFDNSTESLEGMRDAVIARFNTVDDVLFPASGTADSGDTTTMVDAARTEADDVWNGNFLYFSSGSLDGQVRYITDFVASSDTFTFEPALTTGVTTETYYIIPNSFTALVADAITSSVIAADAIGASELATDAIGAAEIAADAIGSSEIATDAIGAAEIAASALGASEVATDAIDADALAADAIGASEIAADAIGAAEIAAGAIGASEVATDAIDADALAADAVDEVYDEVIETAGDTYTARCIMAGTFAVLAGETNDFETFRDPGDNANRVAAGTVSATVRNNMTITCP